MLKSICADTPGRYQLDDEPGEPDVERAYANPVYNGQAGIFLASVGDEDRAPLKFLRDLVSPRNAV